MRTSCTYILRIQVLSTGSALHHYKNVRWSRVNFYEAIFFAGVEIRNTLLRGFMILRTAHFPIFDVVTLDTSLIGRMLKTRGGELSGN